MKRTILSFIVIAIFAATTAFAQDKPVIVSWSAQDVSGAKVSVPADGKVSVVAFLRADQSQSKEAMESLKSITTQPTAPQVIIVVSGESAAEQARALADGKSSWPIVADADFSASGKMSVHVWPTTVIIRSDGRQAGHLAGMPSSYAADLTEYISFASDKIDQSALEQRLGHHAIVEDSAAQAAKRHLQVATRLLENGDAEKAAAEIENGLKLAPQDPGLLLAKAKALTAAGDAKGAIDTLQKIPVNSLPQWQIDVTRGRALVTLQSWEEAAKVLGESLKLNPEPSEGYYLLGVAYQNLHQSDNAIDAYRKAFESSPTGSKARVK